MECDVTAAARGADWPLSRAEKLSQLIRCYEEERRLTAAAPPLCAPAASAGAAPRPLRASRILSIARCPSPRGERAIGEAARPSGPPASLGPRWCDGERLYDGEILTKNTFVHISGDGPPTRLVRALSSPAGGCRESTARGAAAAEDGHAASPGPSEELVFRAEATTALHAGEQGGVLPKPVAQGALPKRRRWRSRLAMGPLPPRVDTGEGLAANFVTIGGEEGRRGSPTCLRAGPEGEGGVHTKASTDTKSLAMGPPLHSDTGAASVLVPGAEPSLVLESSRSKGRAGNAAGAGRGKGKRGGGDACAPRPLSPRGGNAAVLTEPPYHHFQAEAGGDPAAAAAATAAGVAGAASSAKPGAALGAASFDPAVVLTLEDSQSAAAASYAGCLGRGLSSRPRGPEAAGGGQSYCTDERADDATWARRGKGKGSGDRAHGPLLLVPHGDDAAMNMKPRGCHFQADAAEPAALAADAASAAVVDAVPTLPTTIEKPSLSKDLLSSADAAAGSPANVAEVPSVVGQKSDIVATKMQAEAEDHASWLLEPSEGTVSDAAGRCTGAQVEAEGHASCASGYARAASRLCASAGQAYGFNDCSQERTCGAPPSSNRLVETVIGRETEIGMSGRTETKTEAMRHVPSASGHAGQVLGAHGCSRRKACDTTCASAGLSAPANTQRRCERWLGDLDRIVVDAYEVLDTDEEDHQSLMNLVEELEKAKRKTGGALVALGAEFKRTRGKAQRNNLLLTEGLEAAWSELDSIQDLAKMHLSFLDMRTSHARFLVRNRGPPADCSGSEHEEDHEDDYGDVRHRQGIG